MLVLFLSSALAADEDAWQVGGAVGATTTVDAERQVADTQVQLESAGAFGAWKLDVKLDVHADPIGGSLVTPVLPQAIELRGEFGKASFTTGVFNPQMGLEDWDPWTNYLPAFSVLFDTAPGQVAGGMAGWALGPGEVFAYGGTDLAWGWPPGGKPGIAPTVGGGYAAQAEAWGTWSGVAAYPSLDLYGAFLSGEVSLGEAATVALDGGAGTFAGRPWAGLQGYVVALPQAPIRPTVRLEGVHDPAGSLEAPHDLRGSLGAVAEPAPWLHVSLDAEIARRPQGWTPAATLSLTGRTPAREEE